MTERRMTDSDLEAAHEFSIYHRDQILKSDICGCFYCLAIFKPSDIKEWVDERNGIGTTALCPGCGIDAAIGSTSRFVITKEFLERMNRHLFY